MTTALTLDIQLAQPITQSPESIHAWNEAIGLLQAVPFRVSREDGQTCPDLRISLFASEAVEMAHGQRTEPGILSLQMDHEPDAFSTKEQTHAAAIFLQQLFVVMNIQCPGSLNLAGAYFVNPDHTHFRVPRLDPAYILAAVRQVQDDQWPEYNPPSFETLWQWLTTIGFSESDSALSPSTRTVFGLLSLSLTPAECTMADGLLVGHLLELLMDTHHDTGGFKLFRRRIHTLLGTPHARNERLADFFNLHATILDGDFPSLRPGYLFHANQTSIKSRLNQIRPPILSAVGIVLTLIHDLARHGGKWYHFEQVAERVQPES